MTQVGYDAVRSGDVTGERFVSPCPLPTPYERELLTILIEECGEVVQRATKMMRFGVEEAQPGHEDNRARLSKEIGDLNILIQMVIDAGMIDPSIAIERASRKREKLAYYMQERRVEKRK